jgi:spore germination cell wall hydrolase CwlJ-like protein
MQITKLVVGVMLVLFLYTLALTQTKEPEASVVKEIPCSTNPNHWTCDPELRVLTEAIYFEARSEYWVGQEAVGFVIMNRVNAPGFPKTIKEVVYEDADKPNRCQFSYVCDGKSEKIRDIIAWEACLVSAQHVYYHVSIDPTYGSTFYVNAKVSNNQYFFKNLSFAKKIGSHSFYKEPTKLASL